MYAPWKPLITKKELLNEEEENPKWQEHTLFLSLAAVDLQNAKATQERQGVIFIGLEREASRWKSFPEK
jgi:hypothetical protein